MPLYIYEAADAEGAIVSGEQQADTRDEVIEYLTRKGLIPVSIREQDEEKKEGVLSRGMFETVTPMDRVLLFRNLATALKAGVNVVEALDMLVSDARKRVMYDILVHAKANVIQGQPLSKVFAANPKAFPAVVVGMVEAGERSGKLDEALHELAEYLTRDYELRRRVKSALAYPMILLVAASGVIALMFFFTIPRLETLFSQINVELPLITRIFVGISSVMRTNPLLDVLIVVGVIVGVFMLRRSPKGRHAMLKVISIFPVARDVLQKIALVRFTRTLSSAISSGLTMTESLTISADAIGNVQYEQAIREAIDRIQKGLPLSRSLAEHERLFPHFLTSLMAVGERTGSVEEILVTFADFYDAETEHVLKNLTSILEPVMLVGMGLLIATIAVSMLYPIYTFVGSFV